MVTSEVVVLASWFMEFTVVWRAINFIITLYGLELSSGIGKYAILALMVPDNVKIPKCVLLFNIFFYQMLLFSICLDYIYIYEYN